MSYPNIELIVKHDTSKQGKVFSDEAYKAMRDQLSKLIRTPFINRVKSVWCDNEEHHKQLTKIMIEADDKSFEITDSCCDSYKAKLETALIGVENEV